MPSTPPDLIEWLHRALASPRGLILESTQASRLAAMLIQAKRESYDFDPIQIVCPAGRPNQVWLVKNA